MTNTTTAKRKRRMAREPKAEAGSTQANTAAEPGPALEHSSAVPPKPNKTEKVLTLLKRTAGATLDELIEATGWLPHTTRAALTGLKKKGHKVERAKVDGVSRYGVVERGAQ
jgi:hypothetical protein